MEDSDVTSAGFIMVVEMVMMVDGDGDDGYRGTEW